ncbi:MAG: hypothetical protein ACP5KE_06490 [Candidatus Methanodesulfokora sp.]|jgi:proliferating cell nuclear antigen|nr:MAG: hypothetical protein C0200_03160 [Candidatus Korarchaeota archaeon]
MRVVFDDAKSLKGIVSAISAIVDEATIKLSPKEGLVLSALEPAKTAMVQLMLPRDLFSVFEVENEGFYSINFKELERTLKRVKGESSVELRFEESRFVIRTVGEYKKSFKLPLLAGEPFEVKSPKVEFKAGIRMESKRFPEIISDIELMGTDVQISIDSEKAEFRVQSDKGEAEITLSRDDPVVMDIWSTEPSRSTYSISYLDRMSEPAKIASELRMEIATDKPMKLFYPLGGIPDAGITYYLAHISVR